MAIDFFTPPEIDEIIARIKTYIKGELEKINPTDQNSTIFSLIVALANLSNDNNKQILIDILPNIFPQYCKSEESLINHAEIKNISRTPASSSSGKATIQGNEGTEIDSNVTFVANGITYRNKNYSEVEPYTIKISKLEANGTLVKATTVSSHSFASNINVSISGATESKLNGNFAITVTGLNTFTYNIQNTITTEEIGGDILASANIAILNIESTTTGDTTNLSNGDALTISEEIIGLSNKAYTQYSGVTGGSNIQSFESWKENVVDRWQNPITYFNENNIRLTAKSIAGVTKVWVYPITPEVGQVTVYFIRGNDENIIPEPSEVQEVATAIRNLRTVKDDPDDVFVYAPNPKVVNFTFSEINPDTPTMKKAIKNSLKELFEDNIELGEDLTAQTYNNAIGNSYDMENGTKLKSYTLTTPTTDIDVDFGEYPVLGTVTFL